MNRICRKNQKSLSAYVDGMLPEKAKKPFAVHLDSCPECRKALQELEFLRELLREFPEKHPGLGFETAILNRVKEQKSEITALQRWSRRTAYGLAGLVLLLIVTIYLQKPILPPQMEIVRTPAPGHPVVERNKTEPVSEPKLLVPTEQEGVSKPSLLADKDAEKLLAPSMTVSEKPLQATEPSSVEGKVKSGGLPVSRAADSPVCMEYTAVPEKETGKSVVALQKTTETSAGKESRFLVIRNKTDWEKAWNFQNTSQNLFLPLPEVDFKKQMVVALPTNQAGREYKIVKTEEKPDRIIVQYRVTVPGQDEAVIIPPYQIEVVNIKPNVELQKLD